MSNETYPIIGCWYQPLGKGQEFEVVAIDEDARTVEIQHFDGDLEEIDLEEWFSLDVESIEEPEDWTGPVDVVEPDDLGYTDSGMQPQEWSESLREVRRFDRSEEPPVDGEDTVDEWNETGSEVVEEDREEY